MTDVSDGGPRAESGTYALLLRADVDHSIEVGALGRMDVESGWYVYVGSAFGPGGVQARVRRHARGNGAVHWHIDYLRAATTLEAVWYTHDEGRRECTWASILRTWAGAWVPVAGFGASDCDCPAHLVAFDARPSRSVFRARLRAECPHHAPLGHVEDPSTIG